MSFQRCGAPRGLLWVLLAFGGGSLIIFHSSQTPSVGPVFSGKRHVSEFPTPSEERWMFHYLQMIQHAEILEGHANQWPDAERRMEALAKLKSVKTICETGFNGGHSSLRWLLHSSAHVYSFDLGEQEYARLAAKWISDQFPGRFTITFGDSAVTLPKFKLDNPDVRCDLIYVDGGHSFSMARRDLYNFHTMATLNTNTVMMDDVYCESSWCHGPTHAWKDFLTKGAIKESSQEIMDGKRRGFAVGRFQDVGLAPLVEEDDQTAKKVKHTSVDTNVEEKPELQNVVSKREAKVEPPKPCKPQPPLPCKPNPVPVPVPAPAAAPNGVKAFIARLKSQMAVQQSVPVRPGGGGPPIPVFGCFLVNRPDLAVNMLSSIDHPVETLVLVHMTDSNPNTNREVDTLFEVLDSGKFPWRHKYVKRVITVHNAGMNLGFGAGVNQIVLSVPSASYWLIVSNDVAFHQGSLSEIARNMADSAAHKDSCVWGLCGDPVSQYASFVITRKAIKKVGYFDENFWPAYAEDCDYTARLLRGQCPVVFEQNPMRLAAHVGSAAWTTTGDTSNLASIVQAQTPMFNNFDYIGSKWGGDVCGARFPQPPYMHMVGFAKPFNRQDWTIKHWKLDMGRRKAKGGPAHCYLCSGTVI